jgi:pantetheine-phosphate adenylyltransferase
MFVPKPEHAHLSSSLVREIATLGAPIEKFVPAPVVPLLRERFGNKRGSKKK